MAKKLAELFEKMLNDTELVDCTIVVDSVKFDCHKFVLSMNSEFFRCMFQSDFKESSSKEIELQDVQPVIFQIYREYIYTYDNASFNNYDTNTLIKLYECGKMWMTPSITKDVVDILIERARNAYSSDLVMFFKLAHKHNENLLIEKIRKIISDRDVRVFLSKDNSAFMLNLEDFQKFISVCDIENEDDLFKRYLKFNEKLTNIKLEETKDSKQ